MNGRSRSDPADILHAAAKYSEAWVRAGVMGFGLMRAIRVGARVRHGLRGFRKHSAQAHACHGLPIMRAIAGARGCVLGFDAATIARTYDGVR